MIAPLLQHRRRMGPNYSTPPSPYDENTTKPDRRTLPENNAVTDETDSRQINDHWLQRWRDNNIGWHHQEFNAHLTGHWHRLAVPAETRVLVPLCGKSLDMVWLADQGHAVLGIELSPLAVETFFREQGLEATRTADADLESWRAGPYEILCGDVFALSPDQVSGIAAVYDRASLVALNPQQRREYAQLMGRLLPAACPVLLVAMDYPQQQMQGPPYSVPEPEVRDIFGGRFEVEPVHSLDLLKDSQRYADKGLSELWERVYRLRRNGSG